MSETKEHIHVQWMDDDRFVTLTLHCGSSDKAKRMADSINDELTERGKVTLTLTHNQGPE